MDLESYKGELVWGLTEAWELARKQVKKAQGAQKKCYDRRSREPNFQVGERVFVYMPKDKANKAYKFARPFHGLFRVVEVLDTGIIVHPVNRSQEETIRVAINRVRRCPETIPNDVFWTAKEQRKKVGRKPSSSKLPKAVETDTEPVWQGRLRSSSRGRP